MHSKFFCSPNFRPLFKKESDNILLSYIADIIDALSLTAFVMLDVSFDCLLERTLAFDIKRLIFYLISSVFTEK